MAQFTCRWGFGSIVYLKTDPEQLKRMVTEVRFYPGGHRYSVAQGATPDIEVFEIELSAEPDIVMKTSS